MLLYLSQLPLLQISVLDLPFDILGLYKLSGDPALDPSRAIFVTEVVHMVILHLLYAMVGFYTAVLRQPQYKQLAAAVRTSSKAAHVQLAHQQQGSCRGPGTGTAGNSSDKRASRLGRLSDIDELLAPLDDPKSSSRPSVHQQVPAFSVSSRMAFETHEESSSGAGAAGSTLLPSTSLRGLMRGDRQDWGPIQRFIAQAGDEPEDSSANVPAVASERMLQAGAAANAPPAAAAAALAAATSTAAAGRAVSPAQLGSADHADADPEEPVLLPGGFSPEPLPADREIRGRVGGLQQALAQQAKSQGAGLLNSSAAGSDMGTSSTQDPRPRSSFARRSPAGTAAAASASFVGSAAAGGPIARWEQAVLLLQVLLPFLVSCGEYLLLQLLAAPAAAGIAIAGFALVEVRINMGCCIVGGGIACQGLCA